MNHEKLICYQELIQVTEELTHLMSRWPRGYGYLIDQSRRASASAILTLAEGNGKRASSKDRMRFFQMSLGSIAEVSACLDLALIFSLISKEQSMQLKNKLRASYNRIRKLP